MRKMLDHPNDCSRISRLMRRRNPKPMARVRNDKRIGKYGSSSNREWTYLVLDRINLSRHCIIDVVHIVIEPVKAVRASYSQSNHECAKLRGKCH